MFQPADLPQTTSSLLRSGVRMFRSNLRQHGESGSDQPDHAQIGESRHSLGLYLVYTNFGVLILVMRDGEIVAIQFRHQSARLCPEGPWNLCQQSVMIGIGLLENVHSPVAGQIKALMLGVVTH